MQVEPGAVQIAPHSQANQPSSAPRITLQQNPQSSHSSQPKSLPGHLPTPWSLHPPSHSVGFFPSPQKPTFYLLDLTRISTPLLPPCFSQQRRAPLIPHHSECSSRQLTASSRWNSAGTLEAIAGLRVLTGSWKRFCAALEDSDSDMQVKLRWNLIYYICLNVRKWRIIVRRIEFGG